MYIYIYIYNYICIYIYIYTYNVYVFECQRVIPLDSHHGVVLPGVVFALLIGWSNNHFNNMLLNIFIAIIK